MIVEVAIVVTVVDSAVDMQAILRSVAKVADALATGRKINLFVHSVAQHQQSQSMKIVQHAPNAQFVLNVQNETIATIATIAQFVLNVQNAATNLKSVENQSAHLEQIAIPKQSDLRNQIVQQRQIVLILLSLLSLQNQMARLKRVINLIPAQQLQLGAQILKK
jgi:hypothetical protein